MGRVGEAHMMLLFLLVTMGVLGGIGALISFDAMVSMILVGGLCAIVFSLVFALWFGR